MNATSFVTTFSELWWTYIAHSFWQATLVAIVVLGVAWALRKRSAAFLYAILLVALLKFLIPPVIPAAVLSDATPSIPQQAEEPAFPQAPAISAMSTEFPISESSAPAIAGANVQSRVFNADTTQSTETVTANITPVASQNAQWYSGMNWKLALVSLHAFGALILTLVMVTSYLKLKSLLRNSNAPSAALNALHNNVAARMGLRGVELRITRARCAPMATGVFKRHVILPEALVSLDEEELRAILAHELAHHRRYDLAVVWLEHAIALLWWFNPVFWLLIRALHRKREDCCDDIVLKMELSGHGEYCRTLLRAAKQLQQPATPSFVFGCANKLHPLGYRMARIMDGAVRRHVALTVSSIVGIAIIGLIALPTFMPVAASPRTTQASSTSFDQRFSVASADESSPEQVPMLTAAHIASTFPEVGARDVDPSTSEIRVTFDQDMQGGTSDKDQGVYLPGVPLVKFAGPAHWLDARTLVQPIKLEAGKFYVTEVPLSSGVHGANGIDAPRKRIYFATSGASEFELSKLEKPKVLSLFPQNGATNIVPGPTTLVIRFDRPMLERNHSFVVLDTDYPVALGEPAWNDEQTCTLPVNLKPATTYKVGLNGDKEHGFQSVVYLPLEPLVWTFATAGDSQQPATASASTESDPVTRIEGEIKAHYANADADVQDYIRWTARNFGGSGLWLSDDAFASISPEERERMIASNADALQGEYGRHLCKALAESGALKDKRLLPGLIKVASYHRDDFDYDCRAKWMAVAALGRQDDISVVPTLVPLVDHGNQNTRMWARASLVRLTGQNFSADKQAWGKWWNESGNQPPIDLTQLTPWTPPKTEAATTPQNAAAQTTWSPGQEKRRWGPEQATGEPDTPLAGDQPTAWAPLTQDDQAEWLELEYAEPVEAATVKVYETYNPGALVRLVLINADGAESDVWKRSISPESKPDTPLNVTEVPLPVGTKTQRIKLYLDSPAVKGWNEIDAVALVDAQGTPHWATNAKASSTFAEQGATPAQAPAPPEAPVIGEAVVPAESQAIVDSLPGEVIAKATYHHRSRGGDFPSPSTMWCKRSADGTIVAASYMPSMNTTNVAYASNERGIKRYENCFHGRDGRPAGTSALTISGDQVSVVYEGGEKDGQTESYSVPAKNGYQPNSRPDPYIAHMGVAMLERPLKDIELACFDWDNTGKGMATYDTKVEYKGKEDVTVPAGTFNAHHYVETQTSFGDTWFKKRPGHVTEYWLLDNGLMVRILRHREPYELLLASVEVPTELPGRSGPPPPESQPAANAAVSEVSRSNS
ncbi:MAG: M48 family metalloprotease [Candidatus Hydrogenedentes bacterium]|nr:M48 family metalloprotease [Candidatus Hydrogenedentota bacterium]